MRTARIFPTWLIASVTMMACVLVGFEPGCRAQTTAPSPTKPRSIAAAPTEIWATAWRSVPKDEPLLVEMVRLEGSFVPGQPNRAPDPISLALRTKSLPKGRAGVLWWRYANSLFAYDGDFAKGGVASPWADAASIELKKEWEPWLEAFERAGGRIDVLVGDCEQISKFTNWSISSNDVATLMSDARALKPYRGAPPLRTLLGDADTSKVKEAPQRNDYLAWNLALGRITAAAMNDAVFRPTVLQFPRVVGSNYDGMRMTDRPAPDLNGHQQPQDSIVGTHASPSCYGRIEQIATAWYIDEADPTRLARTGRDRVTKDPWNAFLLDVQLARACRRSAPSVPLAPWIAQPAWTGDRGEVPYPSDRRMWDEMVRHIALCGTEFFHYWNPPEVLGSRVDIGFQQRIADQCSRRLAGVLRDINTQLNAQSIGPVQQLITTEPLSYRATTVTTGARRGDGKYVWRTSARPGVNALQDVKTGARVALDEGTCGRWDITDTATPPSYRPWSGSAGDTKRGTSDSNAK
jgi:hypothetical protein